jgi:hypothetical protein
MTANRRDEQQQNKAKSIALELVRREPRSFDDVLAGIVVKMGDETLALKVIRRLIDDGDLRITDTLLLACR